MPLDPIVPDPTGAAAARDLERRVEALERANQLLSSTILGGTLRVLDADTHLIAEVGELGNQSNGISVATADGATSVFFASQEDGLARPWLATSWRIPTNAQAVTSGTFADIYTSSTELLFSNDVLFRVRVVVDGATTGEMRVVIGGNVTGATKSLSAATDATYEYRKAHGLAMGGGPIVVALQVRRTSGAGNVSVTTPEPLHWGSLMNPYTDGWAP